jgi:hypothetical protein
MPVQAPRTGLGRVKSGKIFSDVELKRIKDLHIQWDCEDQSAKFSIEPKCHSWDEIFAWYNFNLRRVYGKINDFSGLLELMILSQNH